MFVTSAIANLIRTGELQQIWQQPGHTTIFGARVQAGQFRTANRQTDPSFEYFDIFRTTTPADQHVVSDFHRFGFYGYHHQRLGETLVLIGGLSYDRMTFPENYRFGPITDAEETREQVSPKAGLIWTPTRDTTLRAAYARSLGGVSLDQSLQLEPSQVAGFIQSFRSIIPESVAGANAGAQFENYGVSWEQKLRGGTYFGVAGELLKSEVERTLGAFAIVNSNFNGTTSARQRLDYQEKALLVTVNQLVGREWAFGARYRLSRADYEAVVPSAPSTPTTDRRQTATLHQLRLHAIYHHPAGFFAQGQGIWSRQDNHTAARPGDDFWQFNLLAGYRFPQRKAEVTVGVLNLTDRDYRLDPLNLYSELPRERTFVARLQFNF